MTLPQQLDQAKTLNEPNISLTIEAERTEQNERDVGSSKIYALNNDIDIINQIIHLQASYMNLVGQIELEYQCNVRIIKEVNYLALVEEELKECIDADSVFTFIDGLADVVVCLAGHCIMNKDISIKKITQIAFLLNMINDLGIDKHSSSPICFDILQEVFANNNARIQKDSNGKAMLQPNLLPNGDLNPKAGKVIKIEGMTPNLKQFNLNENIKLDIYQNRLKLFFGL